MKENFDIIWLLFASVLVLLMQAGFMCLEAGLTRAKNSINVAIKNAVDLTLSIAVFWLIGYSLAFGTSFAGWIGIDRNILTSANNPLEVSIFLFRTLFCCTAVTIISGSTAERMRFKSYLWIIIIVSGLIYPLFAHWCWNTTTLVQTNISGGWLLRRGFIDLAGATAVHSIGGWSALAAILIIGPRIGRFKKDGTLNKLQGSNLPMAVLGTLLLFIGWIGFNGGSLLGFDQRVPHLLLNTIMAGVGGCLAILSLQLIFRKSVAIEGIILGTLAGLTSITAGCHLFSTSDSIIVGAIGSFTALMLHQLLIKFKIDDAIGAIPVHLGGGIWATLAIAIFTPIELLAGFSRWDQFIVQLSGIGTAAVWSFGVSYLLLSLINKFQPLRVTPDEELAGLNIIEHQASTGVADLLATMVDQQKSGDITQHAKVEPFTEIGIVAQCYNSVLDKLGHDRDKLLENTGNLAAIGMMAAEVAHDVSTPLQTIEGSLFILEEEAKKDSTIWNKQKKMIANIEKSNEKIGKIMTSLLNYAKDNKEDLSFEADLFAIMDEAVELCHHKIRRYNITLRIEKIPEKAIIVCRPHQMERVFVNLINNAIDAVATIDNRWIQLKVDQIDRFFEVSVIDSGSGIRQEIRNQIMHPFFTSKDSQSGTGLGLGISKKIIEKYHGELGIDFDYPNTRIFFRIPKVNQNSY